MVGLGETVGPSSGFAPGPGSDGACLVYYEAIRDLVAFGGDGIEVAKVIQRIALHESLHRFNLYDFVDAANPGTPPPRQIKAIQSATHPH